MGKIYCLMTGGMYLHPRACDLLFSTALDMITSRTKTRSIAVEELEMAGEIRTHFEVTTLETISGMRFEATLECGPRTGVVHFIVRNQDLAGLKRIEWWMEIVNDPNTRLREPLFN